MSSAAVIAGTNFDSELSAVSQTAGRIGARSNRQFLRTFSTLLAAIYFTEGPTCIWWHTYADRAAVNIDKLLIGLGLTKDTIFQSDNVSLSKADWTESARDAMRQAEELLSRVGSNELGVRHLLASYIFRMPVNHGPEALSWNFDPADAAPPFLDFLRTHFPSESPTWEKVAAEAFEALFASRKTSAPQNKEGAHPEDNVIKQGSSEKLSEIGSETRQGGPTSETRQLVSDRVTTADFKVTEGVRRVFAVAEQMYSGSTGVPTLTSRSVYFALVDFGAVAPGSAAGALYKTIKSSKGMFARYTSLRKSYNAAKIDVLKVTRQAGAAPLSRNLGIVFKRALDLARATTHSDVIALRHLTTAFLMVGPNLPGGRLSKLLEELRLDVDGFLYRMFAELRKNLPDEDMPAWENALFASGPRDVPEYSADDDKGTDLLNVKDDVEAFAAVIATRDLRPPLSIGLFGDWGSGKSFFMRMLKERIQGIAEAAQRDQSKIFCSQVVQIPFNAWFYMDQNLWATLVSEIFDQLFTAIQGGPLGAKEAKKQVQDKLEKAEGLFKEARKELDDAKAALDQSELRLKGLISARQSKEHTIAESLNDIAILIGGNKEVRDKFYDVRHQLGLPEAMQSFHELEEQVREIQSLGRRATSLVLSVFQPPGVFLRLAGLVAVFVVPVVTLFVVSKLTATKDFHDLAMLIGSAGSFTALAAAWIAKQVKRGSGFISRAESVLADLKAIREKRIARDTAPQQAELQQLQEKESAARKQVAETELRVQTLKRELDEMQPGARMQKFIRERTASTDYSRHLGLVSLIRKDFQTLSDLLESRDDIPIQRVVLYIDDLDRCPPDRVVEVLEAIHLLLAFSLFVVVVGVDSRWVIRSLQKKYRGLLTETPTRTVANGDFATPHDYLEKIFQIPFWIRAMTEVGSRGMITGLLPIPAVPAPEHVQGKLAATSGQVKTDSVETESGTAQKKPEENGAPATTGQKQGTGEEQPLAVKSTDPAKLILKDFELEYIQELAPHIGRSPRRVKRFVNIYRLLRASIRPGADSVSFIGTRDNPGDHRAALVLLAVLTGAPTLAPEMMRILRDAPSPTSVKKFHEQIAADFAGADADELNAALGALKFFSAKTKERTLQRLQKWEPSMARYSFRPRESSALATANEVAERIRKMKPESSPEET